MFIKVKLFAYNKEIFQSFIVIGNSKCFLLHVFTVGRYRGKSTVGKFVVYSLNGFGRQNRFFYKKLFWRDERFLSEINPEGGIYIDVAKSLAYFDPILVKQRITPFQQITFNERETAWRRGELFKNM